MFSPHSMTREELSEYFHLPIKVAAKEIGVCTTILKKICRNNGIPRWPHRKIQSLKKTIMALEALSRNPRDEMRVREEIAILSGQIELIRKHPQILVANQAQTKKRRRTDDENLNFVNSGGNDSTNSSIQTPYCKVQGPYIVIPQSQLQNYFPYNSCVGTSPPPLKRQRTNSTCIPNECSHIVLEDTTPTRPFLPNPCLMHHTLPTTPPCTCNLPTQGVQVPKPRYASAFVPTKPKSSSNTPPVTETVEERKKEPLLPTIQNLVNTYPPPSVVQSSVPIVDTRTDFPFPNWFFMERNTYLENSNDFNSLKINKES